YVSYVGPMDDHEAIDKFFSAFMIPQRSSHPNGAVSVPNGILKNVTENSSSGMEKQAVRKDERESAGLLVA
ncbi:hypothetical protein LTR28_012675, partial [Elasticomyces elasticus]